jgi:DNA-binding GntR family transcriptional regulator
MLPRVTVTDSVTDALRSRILSHELPEGTQLRQQSLAAELGVSRIPLREAFQRLEAEGLVTIIPHRGAVVSAPSIEEISELFDLRAMIEPDLIRRAIPLLSSTNLREAQKILTAYKIALDRRDIATWGMLNTTFHLALYAPSGRTRSLALVHRLLDQTDRYTRMQLLLTAGQSRAQQEHVALLRACRAREADSAATLLASHVRDAGQDLVRFLIARQRPNQVVSPSAAVRVPSKSCPAGGLDEPTEVEAT